MKEFLAKHMEFISQKKILQSLTKLLQRPGEVILASERAVLAEMAQIAGLHEEAEKLYLQSVAGYESVRDLNKAAAGWRSLSELDSGLGNQEQAAVNQKKVDEYLKSRHG